LLKCMLFEGLTQCETETRKLERKYKNLLKNVRKSEEFQNDFNKLTTVLFVFTITWPRVEKSQKTQPHVNK